MEVIIAAIIAAIAQIVAAIVTTRRVNARQDLATSETASEVKGRSNIAWITSAIAVLGMAFFYLTAVENACSNHDLLVISVVFGAPISILLITRTRGYRLFWVTPSLVSFAIGMPFGHNYGTMTETSLFGIRQGTACQQGPEVLIVLGIVMFLAAVDHVVRMRANAR